MQLERVTRVDAARMSTKILDAARMRDERGWSSKERRGVDGAQKSDEDGCGSKEQRGRVRLETSDKGGCSSNE